MAKSIKLDVITPSKRFYSGDTELVIARTLLGDEGFMAGHSWACKLLDYGELWIQEAGQKDFRVAAVSGGFVDVKDSIIIYTDAAEWSDEIDTDRCINIKEQAESWLCSEQEHDPNEITKAQIAIKKDIVRMNVAEGGHRRKRP